MQTEDLHILTLLADCVTAWVSREFGDAMERLRAQGLAKGEEGQWQITDAGRAVVKAERATRH